MIRALMHAISLAFTAILGLLFGRSSAKGSAARKSIKAKAKKDKLENEIDQDKIIDGLTRPSDRK